MKHQIYKLLFLLAALMMTGCECPYLEGKYDESDHDYYVRTGYDRLTANKLPGLWQCYYPMIVGNVELKEVRIFSNGKADIIMEDVGGSAYYAETYKWRFDGRYISFTRGNTTYQFQITGCIFPELFLRDSRGKYTWAWRRSEACLN
jgi:hypothetical protein